MVAFSKPVPFGDSADSEKDGFDLLPGTEQSGVLQDGLR